MNYLKWLWSQLLGWNVQSYILLFFGLGFNLALTLSSPITTISIVTFIAGALGLTCVLAINNAKPINGWLGLISAILLITVAFTAKNYMEIVMQLSYIVLLDVPVLLMPSWNRDAENKISGLRGGSAAATFKNWLPYLIGFVGVVLIMHTLLTSLTDSPRPLIDSISATTGIMGAILTTLKKRETYYFWLAQGVLSVILWGITAAQGGASPVLFVTYMLYIANDILAFTKSPWFAKRLATN
ncbi:nicotinamide riboside transporter PnuC [Lactobacillus sp. Sy-1]|uniref:nicotinamide riboside transporter PnuC n=1 Tax=Lactobacillus sp. Sy-1 TaxID=2109645 RepID=UPI001C56777E|nr:nicotinamide riboside transporter PnuC [Lactobacillus sp. Sy-1]MBW1604946.1 nicotinamide mononucleotide transporter [Lactobacillus sp. Sy-1]